MILLEQFNQNKHNYADYCDRLYTLINSILKSQEINTHQISVRLKDQESLKKKIESKQTKYLNLSDITDIVGLRIITYFEDEVDLVSEIIKKEFNIDVDNSVDKRKIEVDKFGYKSLHYVVTLSENRNCLPEYKKFSDFKAEIQIRSILQHSWAEIEHDLGYKNKSVIPDIAKRSFYRISALLEVADIEFVNLKKLLTTYKSKVESQIGKAPEKFSLDQDTLIALMTSNTLLLDLQAQIISATNLTVEGNFGELSIPINTFKRYGINTIKDLIKSLKKYSQIIVSYASLEDGSIALGKATPIHTLAEILQLENNDKELFNGNYDEIFNFIQAKKRLQSIKSSIKHPN